MSPSDALWWLTSYAWLLAAMGLALLTGKWIASRIVSHASELSRKQTELALADVRREHERALVDYRHAYEQGMASQRQEHERLLAQLSLEHQRRIGEFTLFTRKRHAVYAAIYRSVRRASDGLSGLLGLHMSPNFAEFEWQDAKRYLEQRKLEGKEARAILGVYQDGNTADAGHRLENYMLRVRYQQACHAHDHARNLEALHELYLSDDVRAALEETRHSVAKIIAAVRSELTGGGYPDSIDDDEITMQRTRINLFVVMRNELARGTSDPISKAESPVSRRGPIGVTVDVVPDEVALSHVKPPDIAPRAGAAR